jgi:hypothetical protein
VVSHYLHDEQKSFEEDRDLCAGASPNHIYHALKELQDYARAKNEAAAGLGAGHGLEEIFESNRRQAADQQHEILVGVLKAGAFDDPVATLLLRAFDEGPTQQDLQLAKAAVDVLVNHAEAIPF